MLKVSYEYNILLIKNPHIHPIFLFNIFHKRNSGTSARVLNNLNNVSHIVKGERTYCSTYDFRRLIELVLYIYTIHLPKNVKGKLNYLYDKDRVKVEKGTNRRQRERERERESERS